MPNATVVMEAKRFDLESMPATDGEEGGFIMARPLPFGMKLERRDKSLRMSMEQKSTQTGRGNKARRAQEDDIQKIDLETFNAWAFQYDVAYCIVDHNLTDVHGVQLDFANPMTIKILDPKVGTEIEQILATLNGDDEEAELEDFTKRHTLSTPTEVAPSLS